jgi:hypothetical protein
VQAWVRIHPARPLPFGAANKYVTALEKFYPTQHQDSKMHRNPEVEILYEEVTVTL